jgi:hypothetical protein
MLRPLLFLLPTIAWGAAATKVEIRNSEVWIVRDGREQQLTSDHKAKSWAVLAPSVDRVAYDEQCTVSAPCAAEVVVVDLQGRRVSSFQPNQCASILAIEWVGDHAIAAECHINPSLNEYIETDIRTRETTRDLLGYDFTRSPAGTKVAHVGWIIHFAPPYAQSNYLQIDRTTIYPLPPGSGPVEQQAPEAPPEVVFHHGSTYSGIHEFVHGLAWSPDSERIALVDCIYDWTPAHPEALTAAEGTYSNRRCSLVVVSPSGSTEAVPLTDFDADGIREGRLTWLGLHRVSLDANDVTRVMEVR